MIGKKKPSNTKVQFLQLNLLQLPSYEDQRGPSMYDIKVKRLRNDQLALYFRILTEQGAVRDLLTTIVDQKELFKQLKD